VPVCYGAEFAPDLAEVAHLTGLAPGEVVALHSGTHYHVYMLGFLPGFPYMGDLPHQLALPRRADPRVRVSAGSIAIATSLTAIYPYESPGGWHLIGTTPIRLFDCERAPPALFAPGDRVLFEPIDATTFASIKKAVESGCYQAAGEPVAG
jgi:KipI family sensor histidine kinase inhibitor